MAVFRLCTGVKVTTTTNATGVTMNDENIVTVAVAKVVKEAAEKAAASKIAAGEYAVDFTVRVKGTLKKGEEYDQEIVAKANPWLLLAAALSKLNGVTVDSLVREALTADEALVDGLKVKAAEAIEAVKGKTLTKCAGKITTKLVVTTVA